MARRIPAGEMRHLVQIQSHSAEQTYDDEFGQISTSSTAWTTDKTVRAKIKPLKGGGETFLAGKAHFRTTTQVIIDYMSTMDTTGATRKRLLAPGDKPLYIGSIRNYDYENFQLELMCGEER